MKTSGYQPYELWSSTQLFVPKPSRLFHLEPIGVGTLDVESLTSYINRLAIAHSIPVGKLLEWEILPLIHENRDFIDTRETRKPNVKPHDYFDGVLNGTGTTPERVAQALEKLTLKDKLCCLTMVPWTKVVPAKKLSRTYKAWCPTCYQEWRELDVFEPLIWTLNVVEICIKHRQYLTTSCPCCNELIPSLSSHSQPGYCSKCQGWLGLESNLLFTDTSLEDGHFSWQLWVVHNLGETLSLSPQLTSVPPRKRITENLIQCAREISNGNGKAFAELLGINYGILGQWLSGKHIPSLNSLLYICHTIKVPLADFIINDAININTDKLTIKPRNSRTHSSLISWRRENLNKAEEALKSLIQEQPPITLADAAKRIDGFTIRSLEYHFPELCNTVVAQWKENKILVSEQVKRSLEDVLESNEFPFPSLSQVSKRVDKSVSKLTADFPNLCKSISRRCSTEKALLCIQRESGVRNAVTEAAFKLHAEGITPHGGTISKLLKKPGVMRSRVAVAAMREARRILGYE